MIQFVAYHVEPSAATAQRINDSCATFHAESDYLGLLEILFRSAELSTPRARAAILTDPTTNLRPLEDRAQVLRSSIDPERVMFSRLVAQIDFLKHHAVAGDVAFVDSDMIIHAPLAPVFAEDFDLAFTYRDNAEMPINGGVILVKAERTAAAIRLLERVRERYATKYADNLHWWGDQHALIDVLGRERFAGRTSDELAVDGVKVRLLPCERYNFSPENRAKAIRRPLTDKVILHFKGERKRLMPAYWNAHLAFQYESSWWNRWQAYRTRWELRYAA